MRSTKIILMLLLVIGMTSCKSCKDKKSEEEAPEETVTVAGVENTLGYGVLNKVKGIWNGPVSSTTGLGSYPEWIVDFRPNAENQISAKNELDSLNDIFMSFFIVKYNNDYKVAFRNGGSFVGMKRSSYFLADSVSETSTQCYYRFSEIIKGKIRAYSEVIRKGDSLIIKSYTNKTNTLPSSVPHMSWRALLQDTTATAAAVTTFGFPKKTITKDFTSAFVGISESIFYAGSGIPAGDPYPETSQPYLGKTTVNYSHSTSYTPNVNNKTFLVICTKPLFVGFTMDLKHRSRYVILAANDLSFTFNYMHPGSYYAYAMYDKDGNGVINSGDWISGAGTMFNLGSEATTTINVPINLQIP
ncbi:MAG: hypothetical protein V4565_09260 [Bacteroidota bacterium]